MLVAGKHNTYEVVEHCENDEKTQKWFKVKCVDFYDIDDLGDQVLCVGIDQEIWVANYHFRHMPVLSN